LGSARQVASWAEPGLRANFPMAIDGTGAMIATVFRQAAKLVLLDTKTGAATQRLDTCGDADDVFFDAKRRRIYGSCGAGDGDGFVALLLPIWLVELGFSAFAIGAIVTSTLIGTAVLTLWVGMIANRHSRRRLLLAAALLMMATGVGFTLTTAFWPLLVIAFVGTMNPTSGDASIFGPLEQTVLTQTVEPRRRTALFARYSVIGSLAGAVGVLAASFPDLASAWTGWTRATSTQFMFGLYAVIGIVSLLLYRPLSPAIEMASEVPTAPLQQSRRLVYGLAVLFGMDSFGTGFLVQSLLALWLYQSFQISVTTAAAILFWSGVC